MRKIRITRLCLILLAFLTDVAAHAEEKNRAERVDLKAIQKDYWANQQSSEVEAVQNRLYTKSGKFELGLFGGTVTTDPFLAVRSYGATVGYYLSEFIGVRALYFKDSVGYSSAHDTLTTSNNITANTNFPRDFKGGEISFNPLYGKLSLMGKGIVYGDMFLLAGGGVRGTESGQNTTATVGLGAQLYVSRFFSLKLDYRVLYFRERVLQKYPVASAGTDLGTRTELSSMVTLGLTFLFGP